MTLNITEKLLPQNPLSIEEMHEAARRRITQIRKEFIEGFRFLEKYPASVTFFGSTRFKEGDVYYEQARSLGKRIGEELKYAITTGGGPGIMEAANRGGQEAGAPSLGLNIKLPHEQVLNPYASDSVSFYYFFSRKVCLSFSAEAYIFFPGGFGTMDELFEILTLVQTHKIQKVPIILVGKDYWSVFNTFIKEELLSRATIDEEDQALYTITDDEEAIVEMIRQAPIRNGIRFDKKVESELTTFTDKKCVPCEGGTVPLTAEDAGSMLKTIDHDWQLSTDIKSISKTFEFENFETTIEAVNDIGSIAEEEGHHPDLNIHDYKKLTITLSTHAIGGLSQNDFILAAKIEEALKQSKDIA
jgi:hypothetical protein